MKLIVAAVAAAVMTATPSQATHEMAKTMCAERNHMQARRAAGVSGQDLHTTSQQREVASQAAKEVDVQRRAVQAEAGPLIDACADPFRVVESGKASPRGGVPTATAEDGALPTPDRHADTPITTARSDD